MANFTAAEIERMRETIWKKYGGKDNPNLVEVAFGTALHKGKPDIERGLSVCFYVTKKKQRVPGGALPKTVTLRLKRDKHFEEFRFPTDVVELGAFRLTSASVNTPNPQTSSGRDTASAGILFEWQASMQFGVIPQAAILSVGHACGYPQHLADTVVFVGANQVIGLLFGKANPYSERIDASLIRVNRSDILNGAAPPIGTFLPIDQMAAQVHKPGKTLRPSGPVDFTILHPPQDLELPGIGLQRNIVHVHSSTPYTFEPTTSGSPWIVNNDGAGNEALAMVQLGAYEHENPERNYTHGVGQVFDQGALNWALGVIRATTGVVPGSARISGAF